MIHKLIVAWFPKYQFIVRHNRCLGIRIPIASWQAEIWTVPVGEKIAPHVHKTINSFILQIWGKAVWTVGNKTRTVFGPFRSRTKHGLFTLACADVPAGVRHSAEAKSFCVFLNLEKCLGERVSASRDFVPVP